MTDWPEYYPCNQVWINLHEYKATLAGDASYLRLLISGALDCTLAWQTTPDGSHNLHRLLFNLKQPLSFQILKNLGSATSKTITIYCIKRHHSLERIESTLAF